MATFGYTSVGSARGYGSTVRGRGYLVTPLDAGNGYSISLYADAGNDANGTTATYGLYQASDASFIEETGEVTFSTSASWQTSNFTVAPSLTAVSYIVTFIAPLGGASSRTITWWGDSVTDLGRLTELSSYPNFPNPATITNSNYNYSIYATYTRADEVEDQSQTSNNTNGGSGEWASVRYRGQGFIPDYAELSGIGFQITSKHASNRLKVFIYAANSDSTPTGSELYSYIIPNPEISTSFKKYDLPEILTLTPGNRYCFYIAPWNASSDAYVNDYRDFRWQNANVYADGNAIVNNNGTWSVADSGSLDMYFKTYAIDEPVEPLSINFTGFVDSPAEII